MIRYIVIGAEYCRYCRLAKTLLKKEKLKFEYYDLNTPEGKMILKYFSDIIPKDYITIPKILEVDEKFLGGFDNIVKKIESDKKNKKKKKTKKKK